MFGRRGEDEEEMFRKVNESLKEEIEHLRRELEKLVGWLGVCTGHLVDG